jgi:DNA-binding MarR family transcriptional regulator
LYTKFSLRKKSVNQARKEALEQEIANRLRRILRMAYLHSKRLVARYGLTAPQLLCLRALAGSTGLPPTALARQVGLSRATLTGILRRLEARGLVTRSPSPLDRRSSLLRLTELGSAAAASVGSPLGPNFSERWGRLSRADQERLCRALDSLADLMSGETPNLSGPRKSADRTVKAEPESVAEDPEERLLTFPSPAPGTHSRGTGQPTDRRHGADSMTPPAKEGK